MNIIKNQLVKIIFCVLLISSYPTLAIDWFDDNDVIWKIGLNQYIKYAKQDSSKFGKNEHPVIIDEKQIFNALKALSYEEKSPLSFAEQLKTVFTTLQIKVLSQSISKGLKEANPDQDIIFVLDKTVNKLLGLKDKTSNAGRIFYNDGKLNMIMGDYESFRSEAFEKAYDPGGQGAMSYTFNFGKRTKKSNSFENIAFNVTGVDNKRLNNVIRRDWLMIDVSVAAKAYLAGKDKRKNPVTNSKAYKMLEIETAKLARQRREIRAEMARMRKKESSSSKSIEECIATLDQLLSKQLITQDEYDAKREKILNDI